MSGGTPVGTPAAGRRHQPPPAPRRLGGGGNRCGGRVHPVARVGGRPAGRRVGRRPLLRPPSGGDRHPRPGPPGLRRLRRLDRRSLGPGVAAAPRGPGRRPGWRRGRLLGGGERPVAAPPDTGEALGLGPSRLTLTVGFGPALFDRASAWPTVVQPPWPTAGRSPSTPSTRPAAEATCVVQACADDAQVAFHAVHNLTRLGSGTATLRYYQLGFWPTGPAGPPGGPQTPRNLLGFHDGTANRVGAGARGARSASCGWGGTATSDGCRAAPTWWPAASARTSRPGPASAWRTRRPPSGGDEGVRRTARRVDQFDRLDLAAIGPDGLPVIPPSAHVRQAAPASNGGAADPAPELQLRRRPRPGDR